MNIQRSSSVSFSPVSMDPMAGSFPGKITSLFNEHLPRLLGDAFFRPLAGILDPKYTTIGQFLPIKDLIKEHQKILTQEISFVQDFWNPQKPLNPQLLFHQNIRRGFSAVKEQIPITVEGKKLTVNCSVIASKVSFFRKPKNLVLIMGNASTCDNSILPAYPFLVSYLKKTKMNPFSAPLRVISLSQYDTQNDGAMYRAKDLNESGQILTETLKKIREEKGPIGHIVAHSLGTIILASALKYAAYETGLLPTNLYFDRGPSSIQEASRELGLGWIGTAIAWPLGKCLGWDVDLGAEIREHLSSRPGQTVFISQVEKDRHFKHSGLADSCHLKDLDSSKGFHKFRFNFVEQHCFRAAHHSLHNGFLDGYHLVPRNPEMLKMNEAITDKVMECLMRRPHPCKGVNFGWRLKMPSFLSKVFWRFFPADGISPSS